MSESLVTITLNTLHCNRESQSGGSNPYLWPSLVWINKTTTAVGELGIADSYAHNVLKRGMKAGDTLTIESTVGVMAINLVDPLSNYVIILTVGMFHDNETPNDAVTAGYDAFQSALQDGIKSQLLFLNSPDQDTVDKAKKKIADAVAAAVKSAISDKLSTIQKGEILTGILTLDSTIGNVSTSFSNLVNSNFSLTIGDPMGGRLLLYNDTTQNGTGDVNTPKVIGQGGWQQFKFLFSAGNNVIYAVNQQGQLLRYTDASQSGGGDVSSPKVVGQGGWQQFKFLFSGGGNILYAVNQQGQLLRYVDASQTGGGDVSSPQIVGRGGWLAFKFLFGGGSNVIYAVNQQGQLLRYVDASQTGGGDVSSPQIVGRGGWLPFLFLFTGWNNIIYAVDQQGELLFYRDASQSGGGDVSSPGKIGTGGWQQFGFLFGGGNGVIYAAEKALNPANNYEIAGSLKTVAVRCLDERTAVNQATQAVNSATTTVRDLEAELQKATALQRKEIQAEIAEAQKEVAAAQAVLDAANKALQACLTKKIIKLPPRPVLLG
ncbi:MAG: tachylectin-related carbohydrate-binding protein [Granulicella sp.]